MQRDLAVLCLAGVEHLHVVVPVIRVIRRHRDDGAPVALGRRDQTPPCRPRKAGFTPIAPSYMLSRFVIAQRMPADRAAFCRDDLPEHRVLRAAAVIFSSCAVVQCVSDGRPFGLSKWVSSDRVRRFGVHFAHKQRSPPAAFSCDGDRRVVAGREHQRPYSVSRSREPFARLQVHG